MKKEMFEIEIDTRQGKIYLTQPYPAGGEEHIVIIDPDQVDTLIKWLEEARAEIKGNPIS